MQLKISARFLIPVNSFVFSLLPTDRAESDGGGGAAKPGQSLGRQLAHDLQELDPV